MTKHLKEAGASQEDRRVVPQRHGDRTRRLGRGRIRFGEISRVSREAPVLILKHRERTIVPGGGANATNNWRDLGVDVFP